MLKSIQKKLNLDNAESKTVRELYEKPKKDKGNEVPSIKRSGAKKGYIYQADTLYMPHDRGFKYLMVVVDAVSGHTEAEPLKDRTGVAVEKAFKKIFLRGILPMPKYEIDLDQGKEFKNHVIEKYFKDNNVGIKWGKVERSRQQAVVEARNKTIATGLFQKQAKEELRTKKTNTKWVDSIRLVIEGINEYQDKQYDKEKNKKYASEPVLTNKTIILSMGTKVRTKLQKPKSTTGEKLGGYTFRSTDIKWSTTIHTVTNIILNPAQPVLYQLDNDHSTAYTYNQLQVVK